MSHVIVEREGCESDLEESRWKRTRTIKIKCNKAVQSELVETWHVEVEQMEVKVTLKGGM